MSCSRGQSGGGTREPGPRYSANHNERTAVVIGLPAEKKPRLISADLQRGAGCLVEMTGHFQAMGLLIGRYRGVRVRTRFAIH